MLDLGLAMFGIYNQAQAKFQKNIFAQHSVIVALFSGQGGKLTLYRPNKVPLEAPQVPIRYQVCKSVGHAALAVFGLPVVTWVPFLTYPARRRCAPSALPIRPHSIAWTEST